MRRAPAIATLLLAAALVAPAVSAAPDGPQAEYRSKVEPICRAEGEAKERIFDDSRLLVGGGAENGKRAGRAFMKGSNQLGHTLAKLRAVPRPEADAQKLVRWLAQVSEQVKRLRQTGKSLKEDRRRRAQKLVTQFSYAASRANNLVVSLEFRHCVFKEFGFTP
jgi:hypothetical protein